MDTAEGAQEITGRCPQPFDSIGMNFAHPITIVISCPFTLAVTDRAVCALDSIVALPFVGVTRGRRLGITMDMLLQSLPVDMLTDSQAALPTFSADSPDHRRSIILVGAVPALLVRSPARRIQRIGVLFAFFPPRSETSRQSPSRRCAVRSGSTSDKHCVGRACATCARSAAIAQVPPRARWTARPCRCRAITTQLGAGRACSRRKWCRCRGCKRSGTSDSGNPPDHTLVYGTVARTGLWHHSRGSAIRAGENTSAPTYRSLAHRVSQLSGRSFPNVNMH